MCTVGGLAPFMINITHFRIKPLPFTNHQRPWPSHSRYIRTETCVCWGMAVRKPACNRYKFITVLVPKRLRGGCFTSETAACIKYPRGELEWRTLVCIYIYCIYIYIYCIYISVTFIQGGPPDDAGSEEAN